MGVISDLGNFGTSEGRDIRATLDAQGPVAAVGRAARSVATAPMAALGSVAANYAKDQVSGPGPITRAVAASPAGDFVRGFTGTPVDAPGTPTPLPGTPPARPTTTAATAGMPTPDVNSTTTGSFSAPEAAPSAAAPATTAPAANDDQARPSNVRAYLRTPQASTQAPAPPTVDPQAFASQVAGMKTVLPSDSVGTAADANVAANTYAKNYLLALKGAQEGYTGQSGRITALANQQLSGAHAEEAGARTEDTQVGTETKRYSLEQQKNLQDLTKKLQDPNLPAEDRRNLEMQLWILHGKPPRPDNRFQAVPGKYNPATGTFEQGAVIDRSTGKVQPLDSGAKPSNAVDPQAAARAAIAAGADKDAVNARLKQMGQPELQ